MRARLVGASAYVNLHIDGAHSSRCFSGFALALPLGCGGASPQPTH